MGHALNIHNRIYKQAPILHDILQMGKVLRDVAGQKDNERSDEVKIKKQFRHPIFNLNCETGTSKKKINEHCETGIISTLNSEARTSIEKINEENYETDGHLISTLDSEAGTSTEKIYECCEMDDLEYIPNLSTIAEDEDHSSSENEELEELSILEHKEEETDYSNF